ncbi:antibiotic biosynthesis monooxygenase [Amnibacterium flavum]|uniref:antibiotic biosynthesis monooxygenase n=1 Tax=Amnibacterium flavum TaxID=2173173 RepID=UPI0014036155|nr:antibiotic biosynthesis monooxygenase [Amnibacterium flavum]
MSTTSIPDPITVSIVRRVAPERAKEAAAWARAGRELMSAQPGYLGSGWVRPEAGSPTWHMLYRFADGDSLADWERSSERRWWVDSAVGIVEHDRTERRTGIEGWFDQPSSVTVDEEARPTPVVPPRWKQMVSIFVVFYPLSVLAHATLTPLLGAWPLPLRVLATVLVMTPLMTYLLLPAATRLLRPWLQKPRKASSTS